MSAVKAASCHGGSTAVASPPGTPVVALAGNPNVGKSTVFNALTGARQHVGNWPGKTVDVARGPWRLPDDRRAEVVDLPGTYSLVPCSPDEELTRELIVTGQVDAVVVALDAGNLARNLYLLAQLLETGRPVAVALTMVDTAAARGLTVDADVLAERAGVPVVPIDARSGRGMDELGAVVAGLLDHPHPPVPPVLGAAEPVLAELEASVADVPQLDGLPRRWLATALLSGDVPEETPEAVQAEAARLGERLAAETGDPDDDLWDADAALADQRYAWAHEVLEASVRRDASADADTRTDKVDRVLTSRVFGLPILLAVMWAVFSATTTFAKPLQDGLASLFDGPVTTGAHHALSWAPGWLDGLVVQGLIGGVGQVLSFIPLMIIMFVLMTLLEDSGYLARAAFLADRLMRTMGLPSRAFLPLLVGFGCNVPALSATRILPDARQRLLLGLVIPYLSCSARLVVYVLMASIFFGSMAGTVVFGMYVLSIVMVVAVGLLLRRTMFKDVTHEPLVLELPPYRVPTVRVTAAQTWVRLRGFLKTASGIIVGTVTAVWLLSSISLSGQAFGKGPIDDSAMAGISRAAAPVFEPLGFGDWHPAAAMVTGFVAKEAVVATMAQTYTVAEPGNGHRPGALGDRIKATFEKTSGGHPTPAALAFLVFLLAYTPCMTTVATQWQTIGRRLTLYGIGMQLVIAWVLALAVFQIGRLI